jgi:hypothetical protein
MGWLTRLFPGGDEIGWDDLRAAIVDAVAELAHHGARGEVVFPPDVEVRIAVPERSVAIARGFLDDPKLDREVGAALANRCDVAASALPRRAYVAEAHEEARIRVSVAELKARPWTLVIEGGDLDGRTIALPAGGGDLAFGRGSGDVVVCHDTAFVSRRAGMIHRQGHVLEVSAADQGDLLAVRRAGGELVRPARTARGRVPVKEDDVIVLSDGRDGEVRLVLRREASD